MSVPATSTGRGGFRLPSHQHNKTSGYRALHVLSDSELASDDDRRLLLGLVNDTANQTAELSFQAEVDEIEFLTDTEDEDTSEDTPEGAT